MTAGPSDIMLSGRRQPALAALHHRQVVRQHFVRRTEPQAVLYVVVRFLLVDCQLPSPVLQTEHAQMLIESLHVYAMLTLYLPVMPRRCNTYAMIYDSCFFKPLLKQALCFRIVGHKRLGKFCPVVRLLPGACEKKSVKGENQGLL